MQRLFRILLDCGKTVVAAGALATIADQARRFQINQKYPHTPPEAKKLLQIANKMYEKAGIDADISINLQENAEIISRVSFLGTRIKVLLQVPQDFSNPDLTEGTSFEGFYHAVFAHEAGHAYYRHQLLKDLMLYGLAANLLLSRRNLPAIAAKAAAMCVAFPYGSRLMEFQADRFATTVTPGIAPLLIHILSNKTPVAAHETHLFSLHPSFQRRVDALSAMVDTLPKIAGPDFMLAATELQNHIKNWLETRGRELPLDRSIANPATYALETGQIPLTAKHRAVLEMARQSIDIFIAEDDLQFLSNYYLSITQEDTPLGRFLADLGFEKFIERLMLSRYPSVYLDGRLLAAKSQQDGLGQVLMHAIGETVSSATFINQALLRMNGSENDRFEIFKSYLTLQEILLSSLLFVRGLGLPIRTGSRHIAFNEQDEFDVTRGMQHALPAVIIGAPSGIECRDGQTLSLDLLHVARPVVPSSQWEQAVKQLLKTPLAQSGSYLFGKKMAYNSPHPENDSDFVLVHTSTGDPWFLCVPAYLHRLKKIYRGLLLSADQKMCEFPFLGHAHNFKGLGLGFYAFEADGGLLEKLSLLALQETLSEIKLTQIQQINLLNFPNSLKTIAQIEAMENNPHVLPIMRINGVLLTQGVGDSLCSHIAGAGQVASTDMAGDAAAKVANEGNIGFYSAKNAGISPGSSDESATCFSLLTPQAFNPDFNPQMLNRIRILQTGSAGFFQRSHALTTYKDANFFTHETGVSTGIRSDGHCFGKISR